MARKLTGAPHVKRIQAHHKRHKQKLLRLFHKVRTHPGCYKPGHTPYRGAMARVSVPRKPKGLNKRGSGLWSALKKGWSTVKSHAVKHTKAIGREVLRQGKQLGRQVYNEAKGRAKAYGSRLASQAGAWGKRQLDAAGTKLRNHVEGYIARADAKVNSLARSVDSAVSSYTGATAQGGMPGRVIRKRGSGMMRRHY